jgi:hypothetical protein
MNRQTWKGIRERHPDSDGDAGSNQPAAQFIEMVEKPHDPLFLIVRGWGACGVRGLRHGAAPGADC